MNVTRISIDLAKNVFQICGVNQAGKVVFNRRRKRASFLDEMRKYPGVPVVMEACYSAHYWGRTLQDMGHHVDLIPPQHVKPFLHAHKSDACDARAISEAAERPSARTSTLFRSNRSINRICNCSSASAAATPEAAPPWPIRFAASPQSTG